MEKALEKYFNPAMRVFSPPDTFIVSPWYPPILRRIEEFIGGYVEAFGSLTINDWYRPSQEQAKLFGKGKSKAAVSEHCFAAAIDPSIPAEFRGSRLIDYFKRVIRLDKEMRIGWLDYQKPNKTFTFAHFGWGFMIPEAVIQKYINAYFEGESARKIAAGIDRNWIPGVRW